MKNAVLVAGGCGVLLIRSRIVEIQSTAIVCFKLEGKTWFFLHKAETCSSVQSNTKNMRVKNPYQTSTVGSSKTSLAFTQTDSQ